MYSKKKKEKIKKRKTRRKKQKGGSPNDIYIKLTDENIHDACLMWCDEELNEQCEEIYGKISEWDVSEISDMESLFFGKENFNADISKWNVSNVTEMGGMFQGALEFNQPLESWNVSKVTAMDGMFSDASSFNQPLESWDVGNVKNMESMFHGALEFNQPLNNWDVNNVEEMMSMFEYASSFNQDLSSWNITDNLNIIFSSKKQLDNYMFAMSGMINNESSKKYPAKLNVAMSLDEFRTCSNDRTCGITFDRLYRTKAVQPPNEFGNKTCYDRDAFRQWYETNPSHPETRTALDDDIYADWAGRNLNEVYDDNVVIDPEDSEMYEMEDIEEDYPDIDEYDEVFNIGSSGGNRRRKPIKKSKKKQRTKKKPSNKTSKRKSIY